MLDRLAKADPWIDEDLLDAMRPRKRDALREELFDLAHDVRIDGILLHRSRLTLHMHEHHGTPARATTSTMRLSKRNALMSLTIFAPASKAASATAAL
jgi:hypothetical protein